ncbi:MAG: ATP-binding protein [Clostridia bacterium]|nr:ATP-binding protein [Clostridia bacterium]
MKRNITAQLLAWKNDPERKPLVLKGVRQCGKTYILKAFGAENYSDVAYFNFEETPAISDLFDQDLDVRRIILELGLLRGKSIAPGKTLLIFDEIQECAKALTSLKYFCENAREYHVACAGSLLGIAIHRDRSFPVGKVDFLTLYPVSFYEFLAATESEELAEHLSRFDFVKPLSEALATKLSTALRIYYIVGGMPEAVETWRTSIDADKVEKVQQQILSGYELDFVKHASANEFPKLSAIWRSIPQQLAKPNNKFIFSQVKKGWRAKDLEDALEWLSGAGLVYKVCKIEKPFFPLSAYADASAFKLYLSDVGLLRKLANVPPSIVLDSSGTYTEFKGAMTENFVLGELVKAVCTDQYYWNSGNQAEVDFVIQNGGEIVPIEVKSEKNVKARSLAEYRKKYEPRHSAVVSMKKDIGRGAVLSVPLYMTASLEKMIGEE